MARLPEVLDQRERLRAAGNRVVFTNGHFDLLHYGHVRYLQAARALGDCLIVGLNGDHSTRQLKGPGRPLTPQAERAEVLAALAAVDWVVIFEGLTAEPLVAALRPDLYVKGGDWAPHPAGSPGRGEPPEAALVRAYGGEVAFLPYLPGHSTTELIARVRRLPDPTAEAGRG